MRPSLILFLLAGSHGGPSEAVSLMTLNYTSLFTRVGKGLYLLNLANEFRGGTYPADMTIDLPGRWGLFVQQYDAESAAIRSTISDSTQQLASAISSLGTIPSWVSSALQRTIVEMLNENHPLTATTIGTAITELITEMQSNSKYVNANAVAITTSAGTNVGNGALIFSRHDGNGRLAEYMYAETLPLVFTSTFAAGAERCNVQGTVKASSLLGQDWPLGSGANVSFGSVDATGSGVSKIAGGSFDTFTVANVPDGWTLDVGTAGSQFLSEASITYKGAKALKIAGDGSTLSAFSQTLVNSSLTAKTPYAINFWAKVGSAPAAGVLTVDLYDGTSVITDEAGTANSFTVDLTTLGTSYVPVNHVFRLSEPLPATVKLRLRLTTALSNSKAVYIDQMTFQPMQQLYSGGPYVALASGSTNWSLDDTLFITVTNDYAGQIQTGFWRVFNMPSLGLILPSKSDASENVPDSFIS